jgi:hypothetical protein
MVQRACKRGTKLVASIAVPLLVTIVVGGNYLAGASPAFAQDALRYFSFVAVTEADAGDDKVHRIGGGGSGVFDADTGWVRGGGTFEHFDFGAPGVPKPSLGTVKWEAKRVVSFTPCTPPDTCTTPGDQTYGYIRPGVIELEADLYFSGGQTTTDAMLTIICNIGFAGIVNKDPVTGAALPEGFFITFTDPEFGTLEFKPLDPIIGITHIGVIPPHELK